MYLKIAKFFLYASLFSVLIVAPTLYFPYIVGKAVFFRVAIDLAIIAFALYWGWEKDGKKAKPENEGVKKIGWLKRLAIEQPLVLAVSAFAIAFVLSCIFGINPWFSFWSNFERGEGGFQILHYTALFLLVAAIFKKELDWSRAFNIMVWISLAVVAYGMGAAYKIPGFIGPAGLLSRLSGTLGNPDYTGTFLLFSAFYAFFLMSKESRAWVKWLLGVSVAIFFGFLLLTQTRGAIVGLGAAIFAFLVYISFKAAKKSALRKRGQVVLVIFIILGALFFGAQRSIDKIQNCSVCDRFLHISPTASSFQTRFWAWREAFDGWKNRPVFGWGPEEYSAVYDKYFNTNFFDPNQSSETWFDRAHSVYFDYLAETGAVGLLAFLGVFAVFFSQFFKRFGGRKIAHHEGERQREITHPLSVVQQGLLLAMPVAYLVQGIVLFDVLPTYINLMLFLAFANYQFRKYGPRS